MGLVQSTAGAAPDPSHLVDMDPLGYNRLDTQTDKFLCKKCQEEGQRADEELMDVLTEKLLTFQTNGIIAMDNHMR